jgi:hypothetical protein
VAFVAITVIPDSVTVGDVITMSVTLKAPKGVQVISPETENGFGDFTVLSTKKSEIGEDDDTDIDTILYQYSLATYKPENCTIPPLSFLIGVDSSMLYDTLQTPPIPITVVSVIPPDAPDSIGLAIKDLKEQQKTGGADIRSLWVLLVIAAAVLIYYLLEKRAKKKAGSEPSTVTLKPPYEEAVEAIEALEAKRYLEQGNVREHVFELSEIFKRYIGRRYDTIAAELTTEEIIAWLEFSGISMDMRLNAEWFFRTSDQVKFAKWKPDTKTTDKFMREVKIFLEATKPDSDLQYELKTERMGVVE